MPQTSPSRFQNLTFYILLAIVSLTVLLMFSPFFKLIAMGGILCVLFNPLKISFSKHIKSETVSSLLTMFLAGLIILLPLYVIGQLIFNEIANVYSQAGQSLSNISQSAAMIHLSPGARDFANQFLNSAGQKISDFAGSAFVSLTALVSNVAGFVLSFILVVFTMYYFLRDGQKFRLYVEKVFPLSHNHEDLLVERLEQAIKGVVQGSFTVALLQGLVSTIGFLIFGVPQPLLWGVFTIIASLAPTVGTLLSLVPAVIVLFLTGHTGAAIGMAIWAFVSIQSIDNFISPRVIGHKANLHPILTLLSVLGGIEMFGYLGFLLGPILMSMFMALLDIYIDHEELGPQK